VQLAYSSVHFLGENNAPDEGDTKKDAQ